MKITNFITLLEMGNSQTDPKSRKHLHSDLLPQHHNIISDPLTSQELATHLKELGLEKANAFENDRLLCLPFTQPNQPVC